MAPKCKYIEVASLLEKRIRHGDYLSGGLPSERDLASEAGISRMIARKAMKTLEDKGIVARKENGRLVINTSQNGFFGILIPAYPSPIYALWRNRISHALDKRGINLCQIDYVHWNDPALHEALNNLNGVFLLAVRELMPPEVLDMFIESDTPVVVVNNDFSEYGMHSILGQRHAHVQDLLDYIHSFGHERIDCINTEPMVPIDEKRLMQWRLWLSSRKVAGEFHNSPVQPYEHSSLKAHKMVLEMIDEGRLEATAFICTSEGVAQGVMRALWDRGMLAGREVSVAAIAGDNGLLSMYCPSLCSLATHDLGPYLDVCIDWMLDPEKNWTGSLVIAPEDSLIYKGESVGPLKKSAVKQPVLLAEN